MFKNRWKVNKKNYITYGYKRISSSHPAEYFILKGQWHFNLHRLTYYIEGSKQSALSFRVSEKNIVLGRNKGKLDFTLQGKRGRARRQKRVISLQGRWRSKSEGIEFLAQWKRKFRLRRFKIKKKLSKGKEITFSLINKKGRRLGYEVTLLKKFAQGGQFFLRGRSGQEKRIEGGVYLPL